MSHLRIGILVILASLRQAQGEEFLQRPRNVTLVSKDFDLLLKWLPADRYPPEVSYTVQWRNSYDVPWDNISHCRDISETVCNLTCFFQDLNNRHWVHVKAQRKTSTGITSSEWEPLNKGIEYPVDVELAPPILQVRKTGNSLLVNTTFSYPSCVGDIFQHLTYDLEFWAAGTGKKRNYSNMLMGKVVDVDITQLSSSNYCLRGRGFFPTNKKWSNFSEPRCILLHEKAENWKLFAFPLLLMLSAGAFAIFLWYKNMINRVKMPGTLDFSEYKSPKLMEFGERELIKVDVLTCTVAGKRSRPGPQIYSTFSPSVHSLSEEDEDEDDRGSPIPYTEVLRFQRKDAHRQLVGTGQKAPDPSSGSGSSQPNGGCWPDLMVPPGSFVLTECVTWEDTSGFPESKGTLLSEGSSVEELLGFPTNCPAAGGGAQEAMNRDIDILLQLPIPMERPDCIFPTGMQCLAAEGHLEANHGRLEGSEIAPFGLQGKQDSCEFLLEEQLIDERGFENDSSGCERCMVEIPLLNVSCEGLENVVLGGNRDLEMDNIPEPTFHQYRPRPVLLNYFLSCPPKEEENISRPPRDCK